MTARMPQHGYDLRLSALKWKQIQTTCDNFQVKGENEADEAQDVS